MQDAVHVPPVNISTEKGFSSEEEKRISVVSFSAIANWNAHEILVKMKLQSTSGDINKS